MRLALQNKRLLKEVGAGYTFVWSGRKKEQRRDRLTTLRLPLSGKRRATIVSAYAPTMTNPDEVKDKFYDDLDAVISAAPRTDKHPPRGL